MEHEFEKLPPGSKQERTPLFAGIDLSYTDIVADCFSHQHETLAHIMQINYCRAGQIVWNMKGGDSIFLNPGDFSVHTLNICADSFLQFPLGRYQGLTISIDLQEASAHPPELVAKTGIFSGLLREKFRLDQTAADQGSGTASVSRTDRICTAKRAGRISPRTGGACSGDSQPSSSAHGAEGHN